VDRPVALRVLYVVGVGALLLALLVGWYTISGQVGEEHLSYTLSPFGVQVSNATSTSETSYSAVDLEETGQLYSVVAVLSVSAVALGLTAGLLARGGTTPRRARVLFLVSLATVAVTAAGPVLLAVAQPAAVCSDSQSFSRPFATLSSAQSDAGTSCTWEFTSGGAWIAPGQPTGPGNTFVGQSALYGSSLVWGPSVGWYLSLVGAAIFAGATAWNVPHWPRTGAARPPLARRHARASDPEDANARPRW
jgi:hypothetical protein